MFQFYKILIYKQNYTACCYFIFILFLFSVPPPFEHPDFLMTLKYLYLLVKIWRCHFSTSFCCHETKKEKTRGSWSSNNCMTLVYTTNQLLFATTFSCDLPKMNWINGINFHDKALSTPFFFLLQLYGKYWSMARNTWLYLQQWGSREPCEISCTQIKVSLHCMSLTSYN